MSKDMDSDGETLVENGRSHLWNGIVWVAKFYGILFAFGGVAYIIQFIRLHLPFQTLSTILYAIQIVVALAAFVAIDAHIPLWFKKRIPVIRVGASSRAETYAKWYAWYSMK